jgi:hypothetical protein
MSFPLPKKNKRTEAKADGKVAKWLHSNYPHDFALEVKIKGGKVLDHQKKALDQVSEGRFLYKIPDMGQRNPFDYVSLTKADSLLCTVDGKDVECIVYSNKQKFNFKI